MQDQDLIVYALYVWIAASFVWLISSLLRGREVRQQEHALVSNSELDDGDQPMSAPSALALPDELDLRHQDAEESLTTTSELANVAVAGGVRSRSRSGSAPSGPAHSDNNRRDSESSSSSDSSAPEGADSQRADSGRADSGRADSGRADSGRADSEGADELDTTVSEEVKALAEDEDPTHMVVDDAFDEEISLDPVAELAEISDLPDAVAAEPVHDDESLSEQDQDEVENLESSASASDIASKEETSKEETSKDDESEPETSDELTMADVLTGIRLPFDLMPTVPTGEDPSDRRVTLVSTEAAPEVIGAAIADELERLGFTIKSVATDQAIAMRDDVALALRIVPQAGTIAADGQLRFPDVPDDAVAITLQITDAPA